MGVPAEVESLIADAPVSAHVATSVDDRPHVAPVWYGYRDGTLYFMTGGKKLENLRRNPRVAVSIEDANGGDVAWNVTLLGTATVIDDPDRMDRAGGWLYDRYDEEDAAGESADGPDEAGGSRSGDDDPGDRNGTPKADGGAYALVEVAVRSAAWEVYE